MVSALLVPMLSWVGGVAVAAENPQVEDKVYVIEQALARKDCAAADGPSQRLIESYPEEPTVYRMRAQVGECYGAPPDRVYGYYRKFVDHGGQYKQVSKKMRALEKKLFTLEVILYAPEAGAEFKMDQVSSLMLVPLVVPDREDPETFELTLRDGKTFGVKGVVPGRYELKIAIDNVLVPSISERITAAKGKKQTLKVHLESKTSGIARMLKKGECEDASAETEELLRMDTGLGHVRKQHIEALACLEKTGSVASRSDLAAHYTAYENQGGDTSRLPYRQVTLKVDPPMGTRPELEIRSGDSLVDDGVSGGAFFLLPGRYRVEATVSDLLYVTTTRDITVGRGTTNQTIELLSLQASVVEVPAFDPSFDLVLQSPTKHRASLFSDGQGQDLRVAAGLASVDVAFKGTQKTLSYDFEITPDHYQLPLPTALVFVSGRTKVYSLLPPASHEDRVSRPLQVPVPGAKDGTTFRVSTEDVVLPPGAVGRFEVTASRYAPVADYRTWEALKSQQKKKRLLSVSAGTLTGGLAAAGLFQLMQANLLANEADGITDVSQADEYDALIEEANRRGYTGLALVGSAGVGLVATGVLVLVSRSLKTRTTKAWKQFKASSRVPVSPPIE